MAQCVCCLFTEKVKSAVLPKLEKLWSYFIVLYCIIFYYLCIMVKLKKNEY